MGGFCINGKTSLHCFQRTIIGEIQYYVESFNNHVGEVQRLFYGSNWVLQQDKDPKHTSNIATNYFDNNNIISIIKAKVEHRRPKNLGELELYMKQEWTKVLRQVLIRLANTMQE
ncbi:154_t:CDS:2, partial [Gigaspora rosea]